MKRNLLLLLGLICILPIIAQTSVPKSATVMHSFTAHISYGSLPSTAYILVTQKGEGKVAFREGRGDYSKDSYTANLSKGQVGSHFDVLPVKAGEVTLIVEVNTYGTIYYELAFPIEIKYQDLAPVEGANILKAGNSAEYRCNFKSKDTNIKLEWGWGSGIIKEKEQTSLSEITGTFKATYIPSESQSSYISMSAIYPHPKLGNIVIAQSKKTVTITNPLKITADKTYLCNNDLITAKIEEGHIDKNTTWSSPNLTLQSGQGTKTAIFRSDSQFNGYTSISIKTAGRTKTISNIWVGRPKANEQNEVWHSVKDVGYYPLTIEIPPSLFNGDYEKYDWEVIDGTNNCKIVSESKNKVDIVSELSWFRGNHSIIQYTAKNDCGAVLIYFDVYFGGPNSTTIDKLFPSFLSPPYFDNPNIGEEFICTIVNYAVFKDFTDDAQIEWESSFIGESNPNAIGASLVSIDNKSGRIVFKAEDNGVFNLKFYVSYTDNILGRQRRFIGEATANIGRQYRSANTIKSSPSDLGTTLLKPLSIKVYSFPSGIQVYSAEDIENFDIYSTALTNGIYIIKKTDKEGTITSEKIYKISN